MNERLKELREEKELTQEQIASILNVTRQNYSRWETGELLIPLYHLNTLANTFDSSMDYIMGLSSINTPTLKIDEINPLNIGKKLTQIRDDNNLSMRKLAELLNTTHSNLSVYEHGKNLIIISFALEICKKFNISLDWLCDRSNTKSIN